LFLSSTFFPFELGKPGSGAGEEMRRAFARGEAEEGGSGQVRGRDRESQHKNRLHSQKRGGSKPIQNQCTHTERKREGMEDVAEGSRRKYQARDTHGSMQEKGSISVPLFSLFPLTLFHGH